MVRVWAEFAVCAWLIFQAGVLLSRYGDVIAHRSGLGRSWIGLILLATVTSLPELVSSLSAVTLVRAPDLAAGGILGSCVFNLLLLVLLDVLGGRESVYARVGRGHVLSAGFSVVLIGWVGLGVLLAGRQLPWSVAWVGVDSLLVIGTYLVAMWTLFRFEQDNRGDRAADEPDTSPGLTLRQALFRFAAASGVVVAAGVWLPQVAGRLATVMGWTDSFVGTLFVAVATSLPEIAVTIGAFRIDAPDLAVGNVLGSNLFNIFILALADLAWLRGPLLRDVSTVHAVTAFVTLIMTGAVVVSLFQRPKGRLFGRVGWTSLALVALFVVNALVVYLDS